MNWKGTSYVFRDVRYEGKFFSSSENLLCPRFQNTHSVTLLFTREIRKEFSPTLSKNTKLSVFFLLFEFSRMTARTNDVLCKHIRINRSNWGDAQRNGAPFYNSSFFFICLSQLLFIYFFTETGKTVQGLLLCESSDWWMWSTVCSLHYYIELKFFIERSFIFILLLAELLFFDLPNSSTARIPFFNSNTHL